MELHWVDSIEYSNNCIHLTCIKLNWFFFFNRKNPKPTTTTTNKPSPFLLPHQNKNKTENAQYDPQYETFVVLRSREQLATYQGPCHVIQGFFSFLALFRSGFEDRLLYKVHQPAGNSNFLFPLQQNKFNF